MGNVKANEHFMSVYGAKKGWISLKRTNFKLYGEQPIAIDNNKFIVIHYDEEKLMIYSFIINKNKWNKIFEHKISFHLSHYNQVFPAINHMRNMLYLYIITYNNSFMIEINIQTEPWTIINKHKLTTDINKPSNVNCVIINNQYHLITMQFGNKLCKHLIFDKTINKFKQMSHFFYDEYIKQTRLIFDSSRKRLLLFWGFSGNIYEYVINENKWKHLRIKLPKQLGGFGCVLYKNRYIIILGGHNSDSILIWDMKYDIIYQSNIRCPKKSRFKAVLINNNQLCSLIINGYIRLLNIEIPPNDVLNLMYTFIGYYNAFIHLIEFSTYGKKGGHWRIAVQDIFQRNYNKKKRRYNMGYSLQ
eukprot:98504_1